MGGSKQAAPPPHPPYATQAAAASFPPGAQGAKLAAMKTPWSPALPALLRLGAALLLLGAGGLTGCKPPAPAQVGPPATSDERPEAPPPAAAGAGAPLSSEALQALVEGARACAGGEACALAGAGTCTCAQPVNASRAAEIDAAAARVDCGGAVVRCANPGVARCEAGQCVGVAP